MRIEHEKSHQNLYEMYKFQNTHGCIHGKSPVITATTSKSIESFSVCRGFCSDHFGNKCLQDRTYFYRDIVHILFFAKNAKQPKKYLTHIFMKIKLNSLNLITKMINVKSSTNPESFSKFRISFNSRSFQNQSWGEN